MEIMEALVGVCDDLEADASLFLITITAEASKSANLGGADIFLLHRGARYHIADALAELNYGVSYSADLWVTCCCPEGESERRPYLAAQRNRKLVYEGSIDVDVTMKNNALLEAWLGPGDDVPIVSDWVIENVDKTLELETISYENECSN
jgi:hypothetical protein